MNEVVSVIVPVYNCKEYLERCIESILHQTYPHIQLILVDDGSADGSSEICDCYAAQDARVQVIHQENSGVSTARNRGINVASGHFLYFVDGDDAIATNTLETALNEFDDSVDAVFWGITKNSEPTAYVQELPIESGIFERDAVLCGILKDYAGYGGGYPTNKIWRLTIYDNSEAIPHFNPKLYYFEDLEWVVRMLIHTANVRILPDHFYYYTVHSESVTNKKGAEEHRECGYHQAVWKVIADLKSKNEIQKWFCGRYYPELVNGVLFAWKNKYRNLRDTLMAKLVLWKDEILTSDSVNRKIKLRCRAILFLHSIHLL